MKSKPKITLFLFFVISVAEIVGEGLGSPWLIQLTKPLLMPLLLIWYLLESDRLNQTVNLTVITALLFSFLGDVFLLFKSNELFFLFGLASFLYAQVSYIITFSKDLTFKAINKPYLALIFTSFSVPLAILFYSLWDNLGDLVVPVIIYGSVVSLMGITACLRKDFVNYHSFINTFAGALMFVASDSLIAIDRFIFNYDLFLGDVFIMLLYISGQYFIIKGILLNNKQLPLTTNN